MQQTGKKDRTVVRGQIMETVDLILFDLVGIKSLQEPGYLQLVSLVTTGLHIPSLDTLDQGVHHSVILTNPRSHKCCEVNRIREVTGWQFAQCFLIMIEKKCKKKTKDIIVC